MSRPATPRPTSQHRPRHLLGAPDTDEEAAMTREEIVEPAAPADDEAERLAHDELRLRWDLAFAGTSRGIWIVDSQAIVRSVNPAFARMHGGAVLDFVGQPKARFESPVPTAPALATRPEVRDEGLVHTDCEHVRLDGSVFPVRRRRRSPRARLRGRGSERPHGSTT